MTPEQIALVQQSFEKVRPLADTAAALFYDRLFTLDPSARDLFHNDMKEQGRKLMQTLALVVAGLTKLDTIVPKVQELGRRHVDYGVRLEQYDTVGAALLWTLGQGLGDDFTPETEAAWAAAYALLAGVMKDAAVAA